MKIQNIWNWLIFCVKFWHKTLHMKKSTVYCTENVIYVLDFVWFCFNENNWRLLLAAAAVPLLEIETAKNLHENKEKLGVLTWENLEKADIKQKHSSAVAM